jgi:hypothetical protein
VFDCYTVFMPNPPKPVEQKRLLGNPGKRAMPDSEASITLYAGSCEPLQPLGLAGRALWDAVFGEGELWVSPRTDVAWLQVVCELLDRREVLKVEWLADPTNRQVNMSLLETEKLLQSGLGLLGFTPTDRSRLGVAEVKAKSKLEELMERRANRES